VPVIATGRQGGRTGRSTRLSMQDGRATLSVSRSRGAADPWRCVQMKPELRVVDNRVFLLGLDELYREAMKSHERGELRDAARSVASALDLDPAKGRDDPVEGYYTEDARLTEYFRLMRSLQAVDDRRRPE